MAALSRRRSQTPGLVPWFLIAGWVLGIAWAGPAAARGGPEVGEAITVRGVATDATGTPLPDVRVVLEASRSHFSLRSLSREQVNARRLSTETNERGEFELRWLWDPYFNTFELLVAVPVKTAGGEDLRVLQRLDVTRRMGQGGEVIAAPVVDDTRFLESMRRFVAALRTDDERRIYREMGFPEEIKTVKHPRHTDVTWWYFASGRAYLFRDGRLVTVEEFRPVERF